jgi:hypothetical protein
MSDHDGWGVEPSPITEYQLQHVARNRTPAKKKYKKPEGDIQKACTEYMEHLGFIVMRTNAGVIKIAEGQYFHGVPEGYADLHCCAWGLFLAVETKAPKKDLKPKQEEYRAKVEAKGGTYIAPHSVAELRTGLVAAYGLQRVAQWEADAASRVNAKAQRREALMRKNGQIK